MSQETFVIPNSSGAAFRQAVNNSLQAIASANKGSARPSTPYAGQMWIDDDTPSSTVWTHYLYDGTDDIVIGYIDITNNRYVSLSNQAADVASASTIDLDACTGDLVDVTGTTTITAITLTQGRSRTVRFTGALTLTHGASLVLPGGANITTAAGDFAIFRGYASSVVRCVSYFRANGTPVGGASFKLGSFSFDISTTGSQAITGVGFLPKGILFFGGVQSSVKMSHIGATDGSASGMIADANGISSGTYETTGSPVYIIQSTGNYNVAALSSLDSDGFTLNKTKTGTPTGTATIYYLAMR